MSLNASAVDTNFSPDDFSSKLKKNFHWDIDDWEKLTKSQIESTHRQEIAPAST